MKRTTAVASVAVGAVAAGLLKTGAAVRAALGLPGDERGVLPVSAEC
ncbi:hypothetical protein ACFYXH_23880 [Streptomyces sp. NPDC002730]